MLVAAFNGGFRLSTGAGGFFSYGQVGARLRDGLGSIVTYADGSTDIGAWNQEVPAPGRQVVSVRQNLKLLIDHGTAGSDIGLPHVLGRDAGRRDRPGPLSAGDHLRRASDLGRRRAPDGGATRTGVAGRAAS